MNCVDLEEKPRKSQTFYAKSSNEHHDRITVKEHIEKVSSLAGTFGEEICPMQHRLQGCSTISGSIARHFRGYWMVRCKMLIMRLPVL